MIQLAERPPTPEELEAIRRVGDRVAQGVVWRALVRATGCAIGLLILCVLVGVFFGLIGRAGVWRGAVVTSLVVFVLLGSVSFVWVFVAGVREGRRRVRHLREPVDRVLLTMLTFERAWAVQPDEVDPGVSRPDCAAMRTEEGVVVLAVRGSALWAEDAEHPRGVLTLVSFPWSPNGHGNAMHTLERCVASGGVVELGPPIPERYVHAWPGGYAWNPAVAEMGYHELARSLHASPAWGLPASDFIAPDAFGPGGLGEAGR